MFNKSLAVWLAALVALLVVSLALVGNATAQERTVQVSRQTVTTSGAYAGTGEAQDWVQAGTPNSAQASTESTGNSAGDPTSPWMDIVLIAALVIVVSSMNMRWREHAR